MSTGIQAFWGVAIAQSHNVASQKLLILNFSPWKIPISELKNKL